MPSPMPLAPRFSAKLPSNTPRLPSCLNVAGVFVSSERPLMLIMPATSKRLLPSGLIEVDTKRATGNCLVLNQSLPATSSLPSSEPVSMLASSMSISALASAGFAGSKLIRPLKRLKLPSSGTFICLYAKLTALLSASSWLNSMAWAPADSNRAARPTNGTICRVRGFIRLKDDERAVRFMTELQSANETIGSLYASRARGNRLHLSNYCCSNGNNRTGRFYGPTRQHAALRAGGRTRQLLRRRATDERGALGGDAAGGGARSTPRDKAAGSQHPAPEPHVGWRDLPGKMPRNPRAGGCRRSRPDRGQPGAARPPPHHLAVLLRHSPVDADVRRLHGRQPGDQHRIGIQRPPRQPDRRRARSGHPHHRPAGAGRCGAQARQQPERRGGRARLYQAPWPSASPEGPDPA